MPANNPEISGSTALAVVSTSLHLLYLAEMAYAHDIGELEIIVLLKRPTDKPQIDKVLEEITHGRLHWIDAQSDLANRYISIFEAIKSGSLDLGREHYEFGVFADYGRSLLANVSCGQYYWLGDGTKIIYETSAAGQAAMSRHRLQQYADPFVRLLTGKRLCLQREPVIFSPFQLSVSGQELNRFDWLRSRYGELEGDRAMEDKAYFFGTYFSERSGKALMTDESYLEYLERVVDYYRGRAMSLVYVPHRHESREKLEAIARFPGVEIERFQYPAEFEFYKKGRLPVHVASFFSTCLFHFKVLALSRTVTSFYLDFAHHNTAYRAVAEEFYRSLEKVLGSDNIINLEVAK